MMYTFLRWCPGALGLLLRKKIYPRLFHQCGRNVIFGRYLDLKQPKRICIGNNVVVGDYVTLDASHTTGSESIITIGDNVFIGMGTVLRPNPAPITILAGASLSTNCRINSVLPVHIGQNVLIAAYSTLGSSPENLPQESPGQQTMIHSGCWLGARSTVTQGVSIGKGSIVGAHGHVTTDLPARAIGVGQPVRIISTIHPKDNEIPASPLLELPTEG